MIQINEELKIQKCLEKFIDGWCNNIDLIDDCIDLEPLIYIRMFGHCSNTQFLKNWLSYRAVPTSKLEMKIYNYKVLIKESTAYQYATVLGAFKEDGMYPKHLAFGGTFVNKVVKVNDDWKLNTIRFDLQCEDSVSTTTLSKEGLMYRAPGYGQLRFIQNWLKIDDRIGHNMTKIANTAPTMISAEYDNPWYLIPDPDNLGNDEDQVKELLYKYCFAFDHVTFHLISDVFADNIKFRIEDEIWYNNRDAIGYLKLLRKVRPRPHHSIVFDEVKINGNEAEVVASRIAPDLRPTKFLSDPISDWTDGFFKYKAIKKDSKWQITEFVYDKK